MSHIGSFARDEDLFGTAIEPARPAVERTEVVTNEGDVTKALIVLRALSAAGLRKPYDFNLEEAKLIWATQIGKFSLDELTEAVRDWIAQPDQDFPAVGDVVAVCNGLRKEQEKERRITDAQERRVTEAKDWDGCQECSDNKWVRAYGPVIKTDIAKGVPEKYEVPDGTVVETRSHYMRPCSLCPDMRRAWELFSTSHFTADHISSGACKQCREYHEPWRPRKLHA